MFTDMVGFTALMQQDEKSGLEKRARHKEVIEKTHINHNGEIIQYFGDGTLSIFNNSVDAVNCAIDIQRDLKDPVEVPLRIGIHSGNIVVEEDGILGDAVNIASRIESFANVGGVLISDVVHEQVKNQDRTEFIQLGKFSLKNVERPFDIYAVSSEGLVVPSPDLLKGKGERATVPDNLPVPPGPIIGREKEVMELSDLLLSNKVVTITGTGGMGKTRISIETGTRLKSEFYGGVTFITLSTLPNDAKILPLIADTLDVKEATGRDLINGISSIISDKKVLLILDNLEHISTAAMEVAELISHCPNLRILCTSRAALKIKAEQEYSLRTLPLPTGIGSGSLLGYASIELFVNRARKVNIDFKLTDENKEDIVAICKRMDGLPLALELAAARIRILPPDKLLKRLGRALDVLTSASNDVPERHQTLRQTIDWSYSLLNEKEQILFRRLSVFSGGFTLEAIEEVCYISEDEAFLALDELESLHRNGLVEKVEGARFTFLQTIKDFALELLNSSNESDDFFIKHSEYYSDFTKFIDRATHGENQVEGLGLARLEESNIQSSLDFLLVKATQGDEDSREMGLEMLGDLWMYWHFKGWNILTRDYIKAFMESTEDLTATIGKCKALMGYSVAYWMLADYQKCLELAKKQNEVALEFGDELEITKATFNLMVGYMFIDFDKAKQYSLEATEAFTRLGENYWIGLSYFFQGNIYLIAGDLTTAQQRFNTAIEMTKLSNDNQHKGGAYGGLAMIEYLSGNYAKSIDLYENSLVGYQVVDDIAEIARILSEMSWAYLAVKDTESARKYALDSIDAYQKVGSPRGVGLSMIGLAAIEAVEGRHSKAIEISSAAECFAEQEGIVNVYGDSNQGKAYLDKAKNALRKDEFDSAVKNGQNLSLREVLDLTNYEAVLI